MEKLDLGLSYTEYSIKTIPLSLGGVFLPSWSPLSVIQSLL